MRQVTELFNGGLVTARVGAMLESGELQRADDCFYREKDPAIWRAPGRTAMLDANYVLNDAVRGIKQLSFDGSFTEQLLLLGRRTSGSPTWTAGDDPLLPATHLFAAPFTGTSGLQPVEVSGQNRIFGTVTSTTFESSVVVASCVTTSGSPTVTAPASSFTNVRPGMVVSGTGITAGTRVKFVASAISLTLDANATASGTVTLTFIWYPFLANVVGATVIGTGIGQNVVVTAVSNQDGTTGHYRTVTLSNAPASGNGNYNAAFTHGTFYNLSGTGREILDAVQFNARKYFVWDGASAPGAVEWRNRASSANASSEPTLTARPIGLKPVVTAPVVTRLPNQTTGWNLTKGAGTYWILITEIFSPSSSFDDATKDATAALSIVESAYLGTDASTSGDAGRGLPVHVDIVTPATDQITVTFPVPVNDGTDGYIATHWGLYIYGPTPDMPALYLLRRGMVVPMTSYTATTSINLTDNILTQTGYATSARSVTGYTHQISHTDHLLGGHDSEYGSTKTGGGYGVDENHGFPVFANAASGLVYSLSTSGSYSSKVPCGIEIGVFCRSRGSAYIPFWVRLMNNAQTRVTNTIYRTVTTTPQTVVVGGPADTLGVAWITGDPGSFEVEIGIQQIPTTLEGGIFDVYDVYVKVYYTAVKVNFDGPAYSTVTFRDQVGNSLSDPARLLPPACNTGDFFQGSLVLNDLSQINTLRYSLPDDPEAFPKPYFLSFNTRKRDRITFLRTLNGILFVGMENSVKRVMYLPKESDTDMSSGLAHEDISTDHGIPGPFCAVPFDMPGKGVFMAYASTVGMFISNAIWTLPLNMDLDWENTVKLSALSTAVIRNYPRQKMLAFYYCPAGATHSRNTRVMYFSYQSDKMKGPFQLPAVGPSVVAARAAADTYLSGTPYLITGHETDGQIYLEDNGTTVPGLYVAALNAATDANVLAGTNLGDGKTVAFSSSYVGNVRISPIIRSRKLFTMGMDRDVYGDKVYLMFSPYGTTTSVTLCALVSGSPIVTQASAGFNSDITGWRVKGTGIDPGTIVLSVDNTGQITLSRAPNTTGAQTLTFDTGCLGITCRGSGLGESVKRLSTDYVSTLAGDLVSVVNANMRRGFELQIEKVPLTFDTSDTLTWSDFGANGTAMRLHSLTYMVSDSGFPDTNRNTT